MSGIVFESLSSDFTIKNPYTDFSDEMHSVQIRRDPLLGDTSVHNPFLKDKARFFFADNDPELILKLAADSAGTCIFCGERIERSTPRYPSDLLPEGRLRVGESLLFPNLFSIGKYHPVVSLSKVHFLKLSEFSPELIGNGLVAASQFLNAVYTMDPAVPYSVISANYLFPAGASLVHPHLQMLVTPVAYSYHERLIEACNIYHQKFGSCYHTDLIDEEKKAGLRYITQQGGWHWLTAFSPMGSNEVIAVHEGEGDFARLSDADIRSLSEGISRVLSFYEDLGHLSFNYSIFSLKKSHAAESFRCLLKIINRQNLYQNYRNDDYFLQKMLQSELIINLPEELAEKLRLFFRKA
jgi:UDPglucose--hexose-1-phosphate uridylyltransferase